MTAIVGGAADTTRRLMQKLISRGFTPEAAAGVAGNLLHESDQFRADTEYGGGPGRGWAQWTGPRRDNYEAWAAAEGLDPTSEEANMGFLLREMEGKHGNHWTGGYSQDKLKTLGDAGEASKYFMSGYERPGVPHADKRAALASEALKMYTGSDGGPPPAALPALQEPIKMANFGPNLPMLMPGPDGLGGAPMPPGMGVPFNPADNPMAGMSMAGAVPPGIDFMPQMPQPSITPPAPPSEPLMSGAPAPQGGGGLMRRLGNAALPGQPFNQDGLAMSEGILNAFTAGKRGDDTQARRERRIRKAMEKSKRLKARGKDKRAARKERKAERLSAGEHTGPMRWLFGK